ncbi:MFS transporter [Nocardioides lianchengensis]|uniref:Major Facilitator Superfamily protein n=1 Tax=Nocardioides lianchengensis TaxID=1045774 RepID=A0A1G6R515_9ACTN|nr:MFS transporter [Nocardioides lianchengensis]NYG10384.1 MFS family permease [Nocardioides lianchengensis]SDC99097.1 Major Facilitator Superfamily protein [Nocardioides lianchengensis]
MTASSGRSPRALLGLAAVAVAFAAADTYVVVLALPELMASAAIPIDELQRAAPIISGFLLGYVAMLPLIGRIADLRGRVPVLTAALVVFAFGSLVTALAYDLPSMVTGRFLQGLGGGGLVPATLALVADLYPRERRGVPLGLVSAVQEIGSVLGPLFGAVVLAVADWRAIFAINLAVGLLLAVAIQATSSAAPGHERARIHLPDPVGVLLTLVVLAAGALVFLEPSQLMADLTWGELFVPVAGEGRWLTPLGLTTIVATVLLVLRCATARHPLVDLRSWARSAREADLVGALFLAAALGGVILAFATADPEVQVFSDQGLWYLLGAAVATVALVLHLRRASSPLVPHGALRARPAWGAVLVSFFVGAALIAALVAVPLFARSTSYRDSQLMAALVLVRFLVALPVGAVLGGYLTRRHSAGAITAVGMVLAAVGFALMSQWSSDALEGWTCNIALVVGGLGFGLALAPVNAAVLASTDDDVHGLASALVVVARMVGMLVGISALTAIGLSRYYDAQEKLRTVAEICGADATKVCQAYRTQQLDAAITQEQTVFLGAAVSAVIAAALALLLFRGAATRAVSAGDLLRSAG